MKHFFEHCSCLYYRDMTHASLSSLQPGKQSCQVGSDRSTEARMSCSVL